MANGNPNDSGDILNEISLAIMRVHVDAKIQAKLIQPSAIVPEAPQVHHAYKSKSGLYYRTSCAAIPTV